MHLLGYILALAMGFILGSMGAGGSILTVPILVYLFALPAEVATGYSLLIIGIVSLIGATFHQSKRGLSWKAIATFTPPALIAVFVSRAYIIPHLPAHILGIPKPQIIMLLFSSLMLWVAKIMLQSPFKQTGKKASPRPSTSFLLAGSAGIGLLSGLVGAGGGFLIVPTLTSLFHLSMEQAIQTSLAIIAINALVGFSGDLYAGIPLNPHILLPFIALTIIGLIGGTKFHQTSNPQQLKRLFGWLTLTIGTTLLIKELLTLIQS